MDYSMLVKSLPAGSKWEHGIMMAGGDYVMIHSRYSNPDGSAIVGGVRGALGRDPARSNRGGIQEQAPMFGDSFPR